MRFVITYPTSKRVELALRMQGRTPEYCRGFNEEDLPDDIREILLAFDFATKDNFRYPPHLFTEWDSTEPPPNEWIWEEIRAGRMGLAQGPQVNFVDLIHRFLNREIGWADLRLAVRGKV